MRVLSTYLVAVLLPLALFGLHVEVPPVVVPSCISTEVSTNIPFNAVRSDVREVRMHFTFEGVSSNCIQVAFGRDADGDGVLRPCSGSMSRPRFRPRRLSNCGSGRRLR